MNSDPYGKGITDSRIYSALLKVRREYFIPPESRPMAYEDRPLSIGFDQTISQPFIVGLMTNLLNLTPHDSVLEVGTGSGYQTAILAELCNKVSTIEIIPELAKEAQKTLHDLGYKNISFKTGDGYEGCPEWGPFDRIIVTAAPEEIPPLLIDQLRPTGRMVIPLGKATSHQELIIIDKDPNGHLIKKSILPVRFVPFTRAE